MHVASTVINSGEEGAKLKRCNNLEFFFLLTYLSGSQLC